MTFKSFFYKRDWRAECTAALIAQAEAQAKLAVLEPLIIELRTERNEVTDRLMTVLNLRTIHQAKPATAATPADAEPIRPATNIRDWTANAQALEDQAFQKEQRQERLDIFHQIQVPEGKKA
jgi:hypothetical protein